VGKGGRGVARPQRFPVRSFRSQARFAGVFAGKSGWQGLAGTAPTGEQFQAAMADYHCFLCPGGGGALPFHSIFWSPTLRHR